MKPENKAPRILIVFGTRPELIKLAPILSELEKSGLRSEFLLVNTAQQNDLLKDQLEFWDIHPDILFSNENVEGNLTRLFTSTLNQLQDVLDAYPSLSYILVQGDTNSALSCANLAFLNQKKLLHVEAGLRTHNLQSPFPEEYNRVIVSRIAHFHFVHSDHARQNLLNEGVTENKIMLTGNTVVDALHLAEIKNEHKNSSPVKYDVVITMHRRENAGQFRNLITIIEQLKKENSALSFAWITHPNYSAEIVEELKSVNEISIHSHLPYSDFIELYKSAKIVITDSGGVTEEASQFGIAVIVFRNETERTEPLEMGHPMLISLDEKKILDFFRKSVNLVHEAHNYFGDGKAAVKIVSWINDELATIHVNVAIIGGGPGGTGTLLKSMKDGNFESFARNGLAIIESADHLLAGSVSKYKVYSDTISDVFLECLEGHTADYLKLDEIADEIKKISAYKGNSIPLNELAQYLLKLGMLLQHYLEQHKHCRLFLNTSAVKIKKLDNGHFLVYLSNGKQLYCKNVIVAPGAKPVDSFNGKFKFAGKVSLEKYREKSITSDMLIRNEINNPFFRTLPASPKIVILGGSHSAFSAADYLLSDEKLSFGENALKIWANKKPKLFYPDEAAAVKDNYSDFTNNDICPLTKRIYRLAGLRMRGRKLYMNMLGLNGHQAEKRVTLTVFRDESSQLEKDLAEADLIIHAFGYKLNMIPVVNEEDVAFKFSGEENQHWVNDYCLVTDEKGNSVKNLFVMGLASGFIPKGDAGGEPSFTGQTNGLWYYQNKTAELILNNISYP
jgi:UDP-N-acetylglucosamine 2-epimerase (non-hydrolysing)